MYLCNLRIAKIFMLINLYFGFIGTSESGEDEINKYIDLLPEDQKQIFLDNVSRRIAQEIKSNDKPTASQRDVLDDELEVHDEFVNKLLEEERLNLRKHNDKETLREKGKDLNSRYDNTKDDKGFIDLTFRANASNTVSSNNSRIRRYSVKKDSAIFEEFSDDDKDKKSVNKKVSGIANLTSQNSLQKTDPTDILKNEKNSDDVTLSILINNTGTTESNILVQAIDRDTQIKAEAIKNEVSYSQPTYIMKSLESTSENDKFLITTEEFETTLLTERPKSVINIDTSVTHGYTVRNVKNHDIDTFSNKQNESGTFFNSAHKEVENNGKNKWNSKLLKIKNIKIKSKHQNIDQIKTENFLPSNKSQRMVTVDASKSSITKNGENNLAIKKAITNYSNISNSIDFVANTSYDNNNVSKEYSNKYSILNVTLPTLKFKKNYTLEIANNTEATGRSTLYEEFKSSTDSYVPILRLIKYDSDLSVTNQSETDIKEEIRAVTENPSDKTKVKQKQTKEQASGIGLKEKNILRTGNVPEKPKKVAIRSYSVFELSPGEVPFILDKNIKKKHHQNDANNFNRQTNNNENRVEIVDKDNSYKFLEEVVRGKNNQEGPYYASVYNYAPENAYFNPNNKYGPTGYDDDSSVKLNSDIFVQPNNSRKYSFNNNHFKNNNNQKNVKEFFHAIVPLLLPYKPKDFSEVYNTEDYDGNIYEMGRHGSDEVDSTRSKKSRFHGTDDDDHPYNTHNLDKNGKTQTNLRAIEKLLHLNYGYLPPIEHLSKHNNAHPENLDSENSRAILRNAFENNNTPTERYQSTQDHIDLDYYFGRSYYSDELSAELTGEESDRRKNVLKTIKLPKQSKSYFAKPKERDWKINAKSYPVNSDENDKLQETNDTFRIHVMNITDFNFSNDKTPKIGIESDNDDPIEIEVNDLESLVRVVGDMIRMENTGLKRYDWLSSTVDIQSALNRLSNLIYLSNTKGITKEDAQLLKYVAYIYQTAKNRYEEYKKHPTRRHLDFDIVAELSQLFQIFYQPSSTAKKDDGNNKAHLEKVDNGFSVLLFDKASLNNDASNVRKKAKEELDELHNFVVGLQDSVVDLHKAITHIAVITNYKNQHWFRNLKELYLDHTSRKHKLEILTHLFLARVIERIEKSSMNGLEKDFTKYLVERHLEIEMTKKDTVMLLKLLDEINESN